MIELKDRLKNYEPFWENWYIDSYIAKGASSTVYKIKHDNFGQIEYSALKVISISIEDEIGATYELRIKSLHEKKKRAENEIKYMEKLQDCPEVVHCLNYAIKDIVDANEQLIGFDILIRMNYYSCLSNKLLNQNEYLKVDEILKIAFQIGTGLKHIHDLNIIHRDIKPENFFIDYDGNYLLGDFGVSKQISNETSCSTVAGTQPYIAPEIYKIGVNRHYTKTADIYSFGIVLYMLLNNNYLPFTNKYSNINQIETAILRRLSGENFNPPANGPDYLKNIVMKACQYNSNDRYQSIDELLYDLKNKNTVKYKTVYADNEKSIVTPPGFMPPPIPPTVEPVIDNNDDDSKEEKNSSKTALAISLFLSFFAIIILLIIVLLYNALKVKPVDDSDDEISVVVQDNSNASDSKTNDPSSEDIERIPDNTEYSKSANVVNGGLSCFDGYNNYYFAYPDEIVCVDKNDSSKSHTVYDGSVYYMNYYDDYLYFKEQDSNGNWGYYKLSLETNETPDKIYSGAGNEFTVYNGKIYFRTGKDLDSELHCMNLDGSDDVIIAYVNGWFMNIYDDTIYYSDVSDGRSIYCMNLDGSDSTCIFEGACYDLCVVPGYMFFSVGNKEKQLYRLDLDSLHAEKISKVQYARFITSCDNRVFYITENGNVESCDYNGDDQTMNHPNDSDENRELLNVLPDYIAYKCDSKKTLTVVKK